MLAVYYRSGVRALTGSQDIRGGNTPLPEPTESQRTSIVSKFVLPTGASLETNTWYVCLAGVLQLIIVTTKIST